MNGCLPSARSAALVGAAMLLSLAAIPAQAQGVPYGSYQGTYGSDQGVPYGSDPEVPFGSYLETCTNARVYGNQLAAQCRRMNGSWGQSSLNAVDRCVGGIVNENGRLFCRHAEPHYGYGSSSPHRSRGPYYNYGGEYGYGR